MKINKKRIGILVSMLMLLSLCLCPASFAAQETSGSAIIPVTMGGIYGGTEVEFVASTRDAFWTTCNCTRK